MKKGSYKIRDVEFRRKVVIEYLSGCESRQQLCARYGISTSILTYWKKRFEDGELDKDTRNERAQQDKIAQLERKVGQQAIEIDFLKKPISTWSKSKPEKGIYYLLSRQSREMFKKEIV